MAMQAPIGVVFCCNAIGESNFVAQRYVAPVNKFEENRLYFLCDHSASLTRSYFTSLYMTFYEHE
jgi:hypothetical protein